MNNLSHNSAQFVNIFPNIWIFYLQTVNYTTNITNIHNNDNISLNLKRFCEQKKITKTIRIDKDIKYWNTSANYIQEIKAQMMEDEIKKLSSYYKRKNNELRDDYYKDENVLIISGDQLEIVIGMFITFLKEYADMDNKAILIALQSKFNNQLTISDNMRRLIQTYS